MKTETTTLITKHVFDYLYNKCGYRVGMEVVTPCNGNSIYYGRCDLLGISYDLRRIICVEVKITLSDFKSKHGHNFVGNKNYYAVPLDLVDKIRVLVPKHIGIIAFDTMPYYTDENGIKKYNDAYIVKNCKTQKQIPDDILRDLIRHLTTAQTSNIINLLNKLESREII